MKKSAFLRVTFTLLLCTISHFALAKNIYLSISGLDTNDGLSVGQPKASFSSAYAISVSGDVINVSGMIDMSIDPANTASPKAGIIINKDLTILGTANSTDGFDGKSLTRLFQIPDLRTITLKNLALINGKYGASGSNGGALFIYGGVIICENVNFDGNTAFDTSSPGGAVLITSCAGLSFKNCFFSNNTAARGGAICIQDNTKSSATFTINGCSFISNTASGSNGGAAFSLRMGNAASNTINLINSTFAKNSVLQQVDGGAVAFFRAANIAGDNTALNIINCTITENTTAGTRGHGAGLRVVTGSTYPGQVRIYNSILEGNVAVGQGSTYSDLSYSFNPTATTLLIQNSFIGRIGDGVYPVECYPGYNSTPITNYFNYIPLIAADFKAKLGAYNTTYKCYPFLPTSLAYNFSASTYLSSLNPSVTIDQLGNSRQYLNNKCDAGAIESPRVSITSATASTTSANPIPVTITFSSAVTGFTLSDLIVGNGTASNLLGSGTTYTASITPTVAGTVTVDLAANAVNDIIANGNTAATQFVRTYYKKFYISSNGLDTNNGLSIGFAKASFSSAYSAANSGDTICVSGMIDMSADPVNTASPKSGITIAKNITLLGTSRIADGFDGKSLTRLFTVNDGYTLTAKNLALKNGKYLAAASTNGGAFNVVGGIVNGENLILDGNTACDINSSGGAVCVTSTAGISFKNCIFSNNSSMRGGAIFILDTAKPNITVNISSCSFISNTVTNGGGAALFLRLTESASNNYVNIVNSTFAKNSVQVAQDGGVIGFFRASATDANGTTLNIINCTITENTTAGSRGNGAGLRILTSGNGKVRIYNSILEGNVAVGQGSTYSDLSYGFNPTATTLLIQNSFVGRIGDGTIPAECYPGYNATPVTNYFNYTPLSSADFKAKCGTFNTIYNYYPLQSSSLALNFGASTFLTSLTPSISNDQLGNTRPFTGGVCYAGAIEVKSISVNSDANLSALNTTTNTDIVVASGKTLTLDGSASLNSITVNPGGKLTNSSGSVLTANALNLCSDALGTATYLDNGATNVINANVQQYLTAGRNWYISSPVGSAPVSSLNTATSVVSYNEPTATWITQSSSTLNPMTGYISVNNGSSAVVTFSGILNSGLKSTNLTRTAGIAKEGFNLVGNPYPSYVSWDAATTSNLEPTMWYRTKNGNNTAYVFDTYNSVSQIGTSLNGEQINCNIPPMQAFWVRVKAPILVHDTIGRLTFTNTMRSHKGSQTANSLTTPDVKLKTKAVLSSSQQVLRLQVTNGVNSDESIVLFNANATNGLDNYDSFKMSNANVTVPEIYTRIGSDNMVINGLNSVESVVELPLGFTTGQSNNFIIKATEVSNFESSVQIILKDNLLNSVLILKQGSEYSFSSDTINTTTRFTLLFKVTGTTTSTKESVSDDIQINSAKGCNIIISGTGLKTGASVGIYNTIGQKLQSRQIQSTTIIHVPVGVYIIAITNNGKNLTKKVILN